MPNIFALMAHLTNVLTAFLPLYTAKVAVQWLPCKRTRTRYTVFL
jgi:hypothetical protein